MVPVTLSAPSSVVATERARPSSVQTPRPNVDANAMHSVSPGPRRYFRRSSMNAFIPSTVSSSRRMAPEFMASWSVRRPPHSLTTIGPTLHSKPDTQDGCEGAAVAEIDQRARIDDELHY